MKYTYINSRLHPLRLAAAWQPRPRTWVFSGGEPWLLLTPKRLERLAFRLGLGDDRVTELVAGVRRWHPHPEDFLQALGLRPRPQIKPGQYRLVLCPQCDRPHHPHPVETEQPCHSCREKLHDSREPGPGLLRDARLDRRVRQRLREEDPGAFDEGTLSPNWRINKKRRLERDWNDAVNRILLGQPYRTVAQRYDCSVGLLHRKVVEHKFWHDN